MRRILLPTLVACSLALLSFTLVPSAVVAKPMTVSGTVTYYPYIISSRNAGGNTFLEGAETANWYGSFEGTSFDTWIVCAHPSDFWGLPDGVHVSFTGYACGIWGTLEILLVGKGPLADNVPHWTGHWVILSGTGDLANLEGNGDWWGVGTSLEYSGHAEFA
ncbi:MAG TPA: hypothetical protein VGB78_07945 [Thermoplasmata archaeon]